MNFARKLATGLAMILGLVGAGQDAQATTFQAAADGLLEKIEAVMAKEDRRTLFFDNISVPVEGTQAGLRKDFVDRIKARASLSPKFVENKLSADTLMDLTLEKDTANTQVMLKAQVKQSDNREVSSFYSDAIDTTADLVRLLNLTVSRRVEGDNKTAESEEAREEIKLAKSQKLKDAIKKSSVFVAKDGCTVSTDESSPYQIQIRTKDSAGEFKVPQSVSIITDPSGNKFAFVDLPLGTTFAIRVINAQKDHDVGARILLDGISSFELSEVDEYKQHGCWYVDKGKAGLVKGWMVNEKVSKNFVTSSLADGLITTLKQSDLSSVGVINVSFFPAWTGNEAVPAIELAEKGISVGPQFQDEKDVVDDVHFGKTLLSSISIRYERPASTSVPATAQAKR